MFNLEKNFFSKQQKIKIEDDEKKSLELNSASPLAGKAEPDKASVLQKISQHPKAASLLKGVVVSTMLAGGPVGIISLKDQVIKQKQEVSVETEKADKYLLKTNPSEKFNPEKFLDSDFIKEVVLSQNQGNLIKMRYILLSAAENPVFNDNNPNKFIKELERVDIEINEAKKNINNNEEEIARKKIIDMIIIIDQAKLEILNHLKSEEYLDKLANEMNISRAAAKKHQAVRINNVSALSFDLQHSAEIQYSAPGAYAYYTWDTNHIVLPYDVDLNNQAQKDYFYTSILHEIIHESTNAHFGLSEKGKNILAESAKSSDAEEDLNNFIYYTSPAEMIVRKQILDFEMEKLGLKKYGEEFTDEHYSKLLILNKAGILSQNSRELFVHIERKHFSKVMNGLAENNPPGKIYHHPDWQSTNQLNQA